MGREQHSGGSVKASAAAQRKSEKARVARQRHFQVRSTEENRRGLNLGVALGKEGLDLTFLLRLVCLENSQGHRSAKESSGCCYGGMHPHVVDRH